MDSQQSTHLDKNVPLHAQYPPQTGVDKDISRPYTKRCIPTQNNVILSGTGEITHEQNKDTLQYVRQVVSVGKC